MPRRVSKPIDDNIDQYLYQQDQSAFSIVSSNKRNRVDAKKQLAKLIAADAADSLVSKKSTVQSKKKTLPASRHFVDLRQNRINRYATFEKPVTKGLFNGWFGVNSASSNITFETIEYSEPLGINRGLISGSINPNRINAKSAKHHEDAPIRQINQPPIYFSFKAIVSFGFILLVLLLPIKTIRLAESIFAFKNSLISQGSFALSELAKGFDQAQASNFQQAEQSFSTANATFVQIRQELAVYDQVFDQLTDKLPQIGASAQVTDKLIDVGQSLSQAAASIMASASGDVTMTQAMSETSTTFAQTAEALKKAEKSLSSISLNSVPQEARSTVGELQKNLPLFIAYLEDGSKAIKVAEQILGGRSLSRVLILLQNNRELRATGGFIGTYALADFNDGKLQNFELPGGGTYDLTAGMKKNIASPYALQLLSSQWQIWDANWWPDFPTSAQKVAWFFQQSTRATVDDVISINSDVIGDLLKVTGPIYIAELDLTVSAENFYQVIQQETLINYNKVENQPKKVLALMSPLLLEKLLSSGDYLAISQEMLSALYTKDIQIYSFDNKTQEQIDQLGWSGAISTTDKDYLQVVSTNLGGGKSDGYIDEIIDHRAEILANGEITITTKITHTNNAPSSDTLGYLNNVDYLRVYVPTGSRLTDAGGFTVPASDLFEQPDSAAVSDLDLNRISGETTVDERTGTRINQEFDHTVFANWLQVAPGKSSTVYFSYILPFKIRLTKNNGSGLINYWSDQYQEVDRYNLFVEQQSGKKNSLINSSVIIDPKLKIVWSQSLEPQSLSVNDRLVNYSSEIIKGEYYTLLLSAK